MKLGGFVQIFLRKSNRYFIMGSAEKKGEGPCCGIGERRKGTAGGNGSCCPCCSLPFWRLCFFGSCSLPENRRTASPLRRAVLSGQKIPQSPAPYLLPRLPPRQRLPRPHRRRRLRRPFPTTAAAAISPRGSRFGRTRPLNFFMEIRRQPAPMRKPFPLIRTVWRA